jgi:Bacterial dnaA protein helix-turn-helix
MTAALYDVSTLPTGGTWPFAWWCRGCGFYRPVDDHEHCRRCVPPMADVLARTTEVHQAASRALGESGVPLLDPERLWHADVARDALVLLGRLRPDVLDEEDSGDGAERATPPTTLGQKRTRERRVTVIQEAVAAFYGHSVDELRGPRRDRAVVLARHVAMFLIREQTGSSLPAIARAFGGRDHTTVLHACQRVRDLSGEETPVHGDLVQLRAVLAGTRG